MSSSRILFPQFRDEQADSKYPFADYATLTTSDGTLQIEKNAFIDGSFYLIGAGERLYLSSIAITELDVTLTVTSVSGTFSATARYDWRTPPENGVLNFVDNRDRPAGMIVAVLENLRQFRGWGLGTYTFAVTATEFAAGIVIPAKEPGVRAVKTSDGAFLTGDLWLVGDAGVVLRATPGDVNVIRVDVVGVPLFKRYNCADAQSVFPPRRYIKTINNCPPDVYGNFTITATDKNLPAGRDDTVLRVYPELSGIVFEAIGRSNV
jgi:hypothetical protein